MSIFGNNKPAVLSTQGVNISSASRSGDIVTIITAASHNLQQYDDILIQNLTGMPINQLWTVYNVIDSTTFQIKVSGITETTGSGGVLFKGVWFKWCKLNYNFNLADIIEHKSIVSGERSMKLKGEHGEFEIDYFIYKNVNETVAKNKFLLLYSLYGQPVYFLPYGVLGVKTSDYQMDICVLKEIKLLKFGGINNYDMLRLKIVTSKYHDITKILI